MTSNQFPTIEATIETMKAEINAAISEGVLPATVSSFSELHDYCDANLLAEDIFPAFPETDDDAIIEAWGDSYNEVMNPAQTAVSDWLKAGRPAA